MRYVCVSWQSLLSHCVQDKAASEAVSLALKSMVSVARSINEWKREHERAVRVAEMQGLLDANTDTDLALLGELLLEVNSITLNRQYNS